MVTAPGWLLGNSRPGDRIYEQHLTFGELVIHSRFSGIVANYFWVIALIRGNGDLDTDLLSLKGMRLAA